MSGISTKNLPLRQTVDELLGNDSQGGTVRISRAALVRILGDNLAEQITNAGGMAIFPTTAAGLAATTDGDYFSVPSEDDDEYLILYRNDNGSAEEVRRYPSAEAVTTVEGRVDAEGQARSDADASLAGIGVTSDFSRMNEGDDVPLLTDEKGHALLAASPEGNLLLPHASDFHSLNGGKVSAAVMTGDDVPIAAIDTFGSSVWHWVSDFHTLDALPAFSFVDANGIVFQGWNQEGRTMVGGVGPVGEATETTVTPQQFGVDENTTGNMSPEFQAALNYLEGIGGGTLYIPAGVYTFSDTVYVPSDVEVVGQSEEGTVLRANKDHNFTTLTLLDFDGTPDNQKCVAMFATKYAADDGLDRVVRNVDWRTLTIDWNEAPAGGVSSMGPVVMSRVRGGRMHRVSFINTLDGSLMDDTEAVLRGGGLIFAFTEDYTVRRCKFGAGDYYTVRTNLLCRNLHFEKCLFDVDKPLTMSRQRHIIEANRPTPMSDALLNRYGDDLTRDVYITGCRSIANNVNDHFSNHAVPGLYVTGCVMENKPGESNDGSLLLRAHRGASEIIFNDNVLILNLTDTTNLLGPVHTHDVDNIQCRGNIAKVRVDSSTNTSARSLFEIGVAAYPARNAVVEGNVIQLSRYANRPFRIFGVAGKNITVANNVVELSDPLEPINHNGPRIINVYQTEEEDAGNIIIKGNMASGEHSMTMALVIDDTVEPILIEGNLIKGDHNA